VLGGLTWENVSWAFTTFHSANWHPLTWLSLMADATLSGTDPGGFHRTNVLLHLLDTELLFFVFWGMTGGFMESALVAALFGVHPLHVESVAWISERKDVLSTLFWILTLEAYRRYVRRPGAGRYLLVTLPFALGLMCKPMLVTLPFVLLLLDFWPLQRPTTPASVRRLVVEKLPLLALSVLSCCVTVMAQADAEAIRSFQTVPFGIRIANSLVAYTAYLGKTVFPSSLAVFYPHPASLGADAPVWLATVSALLLAAVSALAIRQVRARPWLAVGWFWYLGTLVPVIGLLQVGEQAMADRYTYVPLIGIFVMAAWGLSDAMEGCRFRAAAVAASAVVVAALAGAAWHQTGYWRDSISLFSRALAVTEKNWLALQNLGVAYSRSGRYPQAIDCFREALRDNPTDTKAMSGMGTALYSLGRYGEAVSWYEDALRIEPKSATAWQNLGLALARNGRYDRATAAFGEAIRIDPSLSDAWYSLGLTFTKLGRYPEAIDAYRGALRIRPDFENARENLNAASNALERERPPRPGAR
jgi:protein O-mannosyl-transferase